VKAGELHDDIDTRETGAFAGDICAEAETHVLLAMQKVEGSNPFSRFC
jgi:hypothetical protein